jgi:phospholipid-translocating ATPase
MFQSRKLELNGATLPQSFPSNKLNNQKYNLLSFVPIVLINEFKFFFNMFFLLIALSQFIPFLKVGFMFTYIAPLIFVLTVTMIKEAYDDLMRRKRDKELNNFAYPVMNQSSDVFTETKSEDLKVGMIVKITQGQRAVFIKTDQLDGETDWKLRKAIPHTQALTRPEELILYPGYMIVTPPNRQIYDF